MVGCSWGLCSSFAPGTREAESQVVKDVSIWAIFISFFTREIPLIMSSVDCRLGPHSREPSLYVQREQIFQLRSPSYLTRGLSSVSSGTAERTGSPLDGFRAFRRKEQGTVCREQPCGTKEAVGIQRLLDL